MSGWNRHAAPAGGEPPDAVAWEVTLKGRTLSAYERLAYFLRAYRAMGYRPRRILDVGSGFGIKTFYLARVFPGVHVTGIDPGIEDVDVGNRLKAEKGIGNVDFARIDARRLDAREEYDLAIMSDVLEHIDDDAGALRNVTRALKPGGILYIHVPFIPDNFDLGRLPPEERDQIMRVQKQIGHVRCGYRLREVRAFFGDGFRRVRVERCAFGASRMAGRYTEYFCVRDAIASYEDWFRLPNHLFWDFKLLIDCEVRLAGLFNFIHEHPALFKSAVPWKLGFTSVHGWGTRIGGAPCASSSSA